MTIKQFKKTEKGNALFLILIAVALFAALSYAVTQSGRGGGGVDREQALISASQITQYGAGLRTTVTRMIITGTNAYDLDFTSPPLGGDSAEVFHSDGGGAVAQDPPPTAGGSPSYRYLVPSTAILGHYIEGVGTDAADVMLTAEGLNLAVCTAINRGLGVTPEAPASETGVVALGTPAAKSGTSTFDSYSGEAFACVDNGGDYVYYHALSEH